MDNINVSFKERNIPTIAAILADFKRTLDSFSRQFAPQYKPVLSSSETSILHIIKLIRLS